MTCRKDACLGERMGNACQLSSNVFKLNFPDRHLDTAQSAVLKYESEINGINAFKGRVSMTRLWICIAALLISAGLFCVGAVSHASANRGARFTLATIAASNGVWRTGQGPNMSSVFVIVSITTVRASPRNVSLADNEVSF